MAFFFLFLSTKKINPGKLEAATKASIVGKNWILTDKAETIVQFTVESGTQARGGQKVTHKGLNMPDIEQEQFLLMGLTLEIRFLRLLGLLPLSQKQEKTIPDLYLICWILTLVSHSTETVTYPSSILCQTGWYTKNSLQTVSQISLTFAMKKTHWFHSSCLFKIWFGIRVLLFLPLHWAPALILPSPKLIACFGFSRAAKALRCLYKNEHDFLIEAKLLGTCPMYWPPPMAWVCAPLQTWSGRVHSSWCLKMTASAPGSCGEWSPGSLYIRRGKAGLPDCCPHGRSCRLPSHWKGCWRRENCIQGCDVASFCMSWINNVGKICGLCTCSVVRTLGCWANGCTQSGVLV